MTIFDNRTLELEIELFCKAGILIGESAIVLEGGDAAIITREGENTWKVVHPRREMVIVRRK